MSDHRDLLRATLKGFAMGAADAIPGVSGGTIALITGIYDRLVGSIAAIEVAAALALLGDLARGYDATRRERALARAVEMDLPFLVALGLGIVAAAVTAANVIEWAVSTYAGATYAFFFGLIFASAVALRDEMDLDEPEGWAIAAVGVAVAFVVSGLSKGALETGPVVLFLAGVVGISAMVLPGISGSLILLTLGQYEPIVGAVDALTAAVFGLDVAAASDPLLTLAIFATGALIGILSFARVVAWALARYRDATMTFLVALMIGALRAPAGRVLAATEAWTATTVAVLLGWGLLGAAVVLGLDATTDEIEY